jgi:hypothetical protein
MTTQPTSIPMANRQPMAHRTNDVMLFLGVAAFVLGVAVVSQGVLWSGPAAHVVPTTPAAQGWVERAVPAWGEHPLAISPVADRVPPTPVISTASGGTPWIAICPPRRALECDLRLEFMELALQQRGRFLGPPVTPDPQLAPRKDCLLPRAQGSVAAVPTSPAVTTLGC